MITREQVAELRPGDVVELVDERYPDVVTRGPLCEMAGDLYLGAVHRIRGYLQCGYSLTVISRAPRLYVNHDRSEPAQGDVVQFTDTRQPDAPYVNVYDPHGDSRRPWLELSGLRWTDGQVMPQERNRRFYRLRLLVDGTTGQAVTS